jgi:hypothetical protein
LVPVNSTIGRRRTVLLVLLVAACEIALVPRAIFRGETFYERDLAAFYRPAKSLLVPLMRASEGLPLWNPMFASGQPFAANPEHELFHPLSTLFFVLPFEWAFRLQVLLPLLAAALSMFFLLGTFGLGFEAAAIGGLVWGIGGYTLSTTNLLPILFSIAALPAVLAFGVRLLKGGGKWDVAGLALALGLECVAGEPSTLLMTGLLIFATVAHVAPAVDVEALRRRLCRLVAGLLLGAALGAMTLMPGVHHASKTVRAGGLSEAAAGVWSLPPVRLLEFVAPRLIGHISSADERWYWGSGLYPDRNYPFLYSLYPGLLVTLLAGAAAVRDLRRLGVWLATASLGVLLAVGTHFPLWSLVRSIVPGMSSLRYPEKFVLLTEFAATVLAAFALEGIVRGRADVRRSLGRGLAFVGILATFAGLFLLLLDALGGSDQWVRHGISPAIAASWASVAAGDAVRIGVVAIVGLALLVPKRRATWILLLTAADLVLAGRSLVPTKPVSALAAVPPFLAPLVPWRPAGPLFHFAAWNPELGTTTGICKPPIPAQWGIPTTLEADYDLTELRWSHRATEQFVEAIHADPLLLGPLLSRRGVSAVLRFRPGLSGRVGDRLPVGPEGPLQLVRIRDPRPFVFCVSRLVSAPGERGWQDAARQLGGDVVSTAIVDPADTGFVPGEVSGGRIELTESIPGRIVFDVEGAGPHPTFVAVNQTWDEGWRSILDGIPARLVRVDLSLSGLLVPPGRHHVRLVYSDCWVTAGIAMSLAALAATVLLLLAGRRRGVDVP